MGDEYGELSAEGQHLLIPSLPLECGVTLQAVNVTYRTWGRPSAAADNILFVAHALTGNAALDEWWAPLLGEGRPIDTAQYFVVCANVLGSCYGTTGPVSQVPPSGTPWVIGGSGDVETCAHAEDGAESGSGSARTVEPSRRRYRADFPIVTVRDTVRLHRMLLEHLGVTKVSAVMGGSLGGMQALEWLVMYPDFVQRGVVIACNSAQSAWQIGIGETQRQAIYRDPAWRGGFYADHAPPTDGLSVARQSAMVWYRSHGGYALKFGRARQQVPPGHSYPMSQRTNAKTESGAKQTANNGGRGADGGGQNGLPAPAGTGATAGPATHYEDAGRVKRPHPCVEEQFAVQSYLDYQGKKFLSRFDANSYVRLTQMIDSHDLGRCRGPNGSDAPVTDVLAQIRQPTLVIGIDSDVLYPLAEQRALADAMPGATLGVVHSDEGHDGFLLEHQQIGEQVSRFLRSTLAAAQGKVEMPIPAASRKGWSFAI